MAAGAGDPDAHSGAFSTIVFLALRVRYAYALGVLTGLLNIIPVMGAAASILLALLVAAIDSWAGCWESRFSTWRICSLRIRIWFRASCAAGWACPGWASWWRCSSVPRSQAWWERWFRCLPQCWWRNWWTNILSAKMRFECLWWSGDTASEFGCLGPVRNVPVRTTE